jgi:hypothetical protein
MSPISRKRRVKLGKWRRSHRGQEEVYEAQIEIQAAAS